MKVVRILLLKIVNQFMKNIDKILETDTWNLPRVTVMDSFVIVDMYIYIVIAFLCTHLIKNPILRYVVYNHIYVYYCFIKTT